MGLYRKSFEEEMKVVKRPSWGGDNTVCLNRAEKPTARQNRSPWLPLLRKSRGGNPTLDDFDRNLRRRITPVFRFRLY